MIIQNPSFGIIWKLADLYWHVTKHFCLFTLAEYIDYTQPVYVWREDPNSRQNTIQEIKQRASSDEDWPQVRAVRFRV